MTNNQQSTTQSTTPYDVIIGQQLTINDIVIDNENEVDTDNESEFGSRGYDKQFDGAYAD